LYHIQDLLLIDLTIEYCGTVPNSEKSRKLPSYGTNGTVPKKFWNGTNGIWGYLKKFGTG